VLQQSAKILRLDDGRSLEYAEYGDPLGRPVFFLHGYFGSYHQASLAHQGGIEQGIRIIAPNRPGIGKSTPCPFDAMTDYAGDVGQLADHLHLEKFGVIGASGGGCFALACAHELPDRACVAGVFGGIGPMNVVRNLQQMRWFRRMFLWGCHAHPVLAGYALRVFFVLCKRFPYFSHKWLVGMSSSLETPVLKRGEVVNILWNDYENVFLQPNGIQGLLLEANLYFNWGFDLRDIPYGTHVIFWHGKRDSIVSWAEFRKFAMLVPQAEVVLSSGTHMSFLTNDINHVLKKLSEAWEAPGLASARDGHADDMLFDGFLVPRSS
jgi:pimeloyl-ACP methyl ester carboxylesterase